MTAPRPTTDFRARWDSLAASLGGSPARSRRWGDRLLRAYRSPLRGYHSPGHVIFLLEEIDRCAAHVSEPTRLRLAAYFHDFIYRPWRRDNEARSAEEAGRAIADLGGAAALADRVARLIRWTAGHAPPSEADEDDLLFLDMDLAVLGAAPEAYDRYARGVRREYFWVVPSAYRRGRSAFLSAMLARPRMFSTDLYEAERGDRARANMACELARLSA